MALAKMKQMDLVVEMTKPLMLVSCYSAVSRFCCSIAIADVFQHRWEAWPLESASQLHFHLFRILISPDNNYWSGMLGLSKFKEDFGVWDGDKGEWILPSSWVS